MTRPPISCEVLVDGVRLADTVADWDAGVPTALSGLSTTWGREGPQDQPDVGSLTLTVADRTGDADFLGLLHVGHVIEVNATGTVGAGVGDIVTDPGFGTAPNSRVMVDGPAGAKLADDPAMAAPASPDHALRLTAAGGASSRLIVPPAPFTNLPGGWTMIPRAEGGGTWTLTVMVRVGPFPPASMTWQPVGFPDSQLPADVSGLTFFGSPTTFTPAANGYVTAGGQATLPTSGPFPCWLGVAIAGCWSPDWTQIPQATTWDGVPAGSWRDCGSTWLDEHHETPPASATISAAVFLGRITDMAASALDEAVQVAVTASEWTADLANFNIGDQPWLVQSVSARANRIAALTAQHPRLVIDARVGGYQVSWVDVDSQPAFDLLQELAVTGDGVLWAVGENTLWYEDPETRSSASTLTLDPDSGLVVITTTRNNTAVTLSSCDVLRDPLALQQSVADIITRADIGWQDQTLDDKGQPAPTDRTVSVRNDAARASYGERSMSVSTQLITAQDATDLGNRVLARSRAGAWSASGATWDTRQPDPFDAEHVSGALQLLDMASRTGLLLTITDTPAWVPQGPDLSAYVEGGTYSYEDGRWTLALSLAPSTYSGDSLGWVDLDATWAWRQFDPGIAWWDLYGVAGTATGRLG